MIELNLLPKPDRTARWRLLGALSAAVVLAAVTTGLYWTMQATEAKAAFNRSSLAALKQQETLLLADIERLRPAYQWQTLRQEADALRAQNVDWAALLGQLAGALAPGASLANIAAGPETFAIDGRFPDVRTAAVYLQRLRAMPFFRDVMIQSIAVDAAGGALAHFSAVLAPPYGSNGGGSR